MAASTPTTESSAGVVGIVLAAGAGRRMGGPKALIGPLAAEGRTPLARVCSWVHEAGCARVIAVIGAEADRVREALQLDPCVSGGVVVPSQQQVRQQSPADSWLEIVEASDWNSGMGASLRTGLSAARRTLEPAALVTLVDLPDVRSQIYRHVLDAAGSASDVLARACYGGRPGHPVVVGRDWWDAVEASAVGDQGARELFSRTPHRLIECGHFGTGEDVDRPADR
ncbi:MAG TPA: nucleotidyltransferase family protein [Propioniciclava tarda]|nr:nucleotidyltransferase family protein [Propioniciclava tarda]